MHIADILRHKAEGPGAEVVTVTPEDTVETLIAKLAEHNVGALVALDGTTVAGIASERDVVRRIATDGADVLSRPVSQIMTTDVVSCTSADAVDQIAETMTARRIRHMPVVDNGTLAGIVSIGDVVSSHIRQLEHDRVQLEHYISG